jgi:uncharacterized protein (DUF1786 family)
MRDAILCLDIGSGTQDALLFTPGEKLENCPKFVLPSPAKSIARRVEELAAGSPSGIYLHGNNMGGGIGGSVRACRKQGVEVCAHPEAAKTMADDPGRLAAQGITLAEHCPTGFLPVLLSDFEPGFWRTFLAAVGLSYPSLVACCAQDHGHHPGISNRMGRFNLWERFLREGHGRLEYLVYEQPPVELTRLASLRRCMGGGIVCDSGSAAVLGVLFMPEIRKRSRYEGITVVNVGNSHTVAFLVFDDRIWGVYEHHTGFLDGETLMRDLERFRAGVLGFEEVFDARGHGCMNLKCPGAALGFQPTYVIGPRRDMLDGSDANFPAPGGDMMLAGSFGLLRALQLKGFLSHDAS